MLGLRTQETNRFTSFFELVQQKATEKESVFFLDSGDGNEFEKIWKERKEDDRFIDFFCWVEWFDNNGDIDIRFMKE